VMASHTRSELREAARVVAKCVPAEVREAAVHAGESQAAAPAPASRSRVFDGLRDAA
jgi:hypothetical protein